MSAAKASWSPSIARVTSSALMFLAAASAARSIDRACPSCLPCWDGLQHRSVDQAMLIGPVGIHEEDRSVVRTQRTEGAHERDLGSVRGPGWPEVIACGTRRRVACHATAELVLV